MKLNGESHQLSQSEITDIFVKVLSDTYSLKKFLLSQLPKMTYKSKDMHLKMLIVNSGSYLNSEMLRMEIAMKQLNKVLTNDLSIVGDGLDFEKYLLKDIDQASIYNDVKLLNHLMLLVGIEINSFRLMAVLSKHLKPKTINELMNLNLSGAIKYQKMLLDTYNSYIANKYSTRSSA